MKPLVQLAESVALNNKEPRLEHLFIRVYQREQCFELSGARDVNEDNIEGSQLHDLFHVKGIRMNKRAVLPLRDLLQL